MENERDESDKRILAHMHRAPAGHYTAVQLARNTGLSLTEVQPRLARLLKVGAIQRSTMTAYPAFTLAHPVPISPMTHREAADRHPILG